MGFLQIQLFSELYRGVHTVKAEMYAKSSDTHKLQFIKLHHFKLERFKSI